MLCLLEVFSSMLAWIQNKWHLNSRWLDSSEYKSFYNFTHIDFQLSDIFLGVIYGPLSHPRDHIVKCLNLWFFLLYLAKWNNISPLPRFPWNSRGFPFQKATFWGPRLCEVAIIWPDIYVFIIHQNSKVGHWLSEVAIAIIVFHRSRFVPIEQRQQNPWFHEILVG